MGLTPEFLDELRRAIREDWRFGPDRLTLTEWWERAIEKSLPEFERAFKERRE